MWRRRWRLRRGEESRGGGDPSRRHERGSLLGGPGFAPGFVIFIGTAAPAANTTGSPRPRPASLPAVQRPAAEQEAEEGSPGVLHGGRRRDGGQRGPHGKRKRWVVRADRRHHRSHMQDVGRHSRWFVREEKPGRSGTLGVDPPSPNVYYGGAGDLKHRSSG